MSTLNSGMWERLHRGLEKLAEERHCDNIATVRMVIGVILSAGKERDLSYLKSDEFLYHCYLVGMDSVYVSRMLEKAWYFLDNNIPILPEIKEDTIDNDTDLQ